MFYNLSNICWLQLKIKFWFACFFISHNYKLHNIFYSLNSNNFNTRFALISLMVTIMLYSYIHAIYHYIWHLRGHKINQWSALILCQKPWPPIPVAIYEFILIDTHTHAHTPFKKQPEKKKNLHACLPREFYGHVSWAQHVTARVNLLYLQNWNVSIWVCVCVHVCVCFHQHIYSSLSCLRV